MLGFYISQKKIYPWESTQATKSLWIRVFWSSRKRWWSKVSSKAETMDRTPASKIGEEASQVCPVSAVFELSKWWTWCNVPDMDLVLGLLSNGSKNKVIFFYLQPSLILSISHTKIAKRVKDLITRKESLIHVHLFNSWLNDLKRLGFYLDETPSQDEIVKMNTPS